MKIAIVGSVGVPASYGGFETLVESLIDGDEHQFTVYCSSKYYKLRPATYKGAKLVYIPLNANGPMSVVYDILSCLHALLSGHRNLLILGVSGAIILPVFRLLFPSVKLVTNIDGIEWRREKWQGLAKRFLKFSEAVAVNYSTKIVADNEAIADYVNHAYQRDCKTIAYGGDHALAVPDKLVNLSSLGIDHQYALALCRIEPENNVHIILEAFANSEQGLVFVGNWSASDYGKRLHDQYSSELNLRLLDPIYDIKVLWVYRTNCSTYIHGHSAGGTNPSLVEMMHFAKPVIAFDCVYNRATLENKGLYFETSDDLCRHMKSFCQHSDPEMQEIAQRRYTWKIVKQQYLSLFE
jgi:glycosyltransferase involved in cell wall biosynthesis